MSIKKVLLFPFLNLPPRRRKSSLAGLHILRKRG